MMLLRWLAVLTVVWLAGLARAQETAEGPPVPPETAKVVAGRSAAVGGSSTSATASSRVGPTPPPGGAGPSSDAKAREAPAAETAANASAPASDPLRAFPPAPPPAEPGPAQPPTAALTSFAPAPEPPPGGAPTPSAAASEQAEPDVSEAPAAVSSSSEGAAAVSSSGEEAPYAPAETRWTAAALAGVGVTFDNTIAGVNPLGFGFGVRGDYRLLPNFSLGARMLYFVGGSVVLPTSEVAMQSWLIAAEAAYVIEADHIAIQPGLALGLHVRETDYRGFAGVIGGPEMLIPPGSTRLGFYVAPGVNVAVPLGLASAALEPLIAGADMRLDMAFGKGVSCNVQLLVLAGFQF